MDLVKGQLRQVRPRGETLKFQFNPETVKQSGGGPIWETQERPKLRSAIEWRGQNLRRLTFTLRFDGFPSRSVEPEIRILNRFALPRSRQRPPPQLVFDYGPQGGNRHWVIEGDLEFGDEFRRGDLKRVFQEVTVTLVEFIEADVTLTPAERRRRKKNRGEDPPKSYVVKRGDTLAKIAVKFYGESKRWKDIAKLNNIRDPKSIKVGQRVRLPRA